MSLYEKWYEEYVRHRYMKSLSDEHIIQRAKDIIQNVSSLTDQGQIGLIKLEKNGGYLLRLFSHIVKESQFRTGDPKGLFKKYGLQDTPAPKPTYPERCRGAKFRELANLSESDRYLFKWGKSKYLKDTYKKGSIRINPASTYSDPSLNYAIKDDELSLVLHRKPNKIHLGTIEPLLVNINDVLAPITNEETVLKSSTDYLVWCMAFEHDNRLPDDFQADACIVIDDIGLFKKLFYDAVLKKLPEWDFHIGAVNYIDPLHPSEKAQNIFFAKHFRYMYQREFRFAFIPPKDVSKLEPIDICIGSMETYSKFYSL